MNSWTLTSPHLKAIVDVLMDLLVILLLLFLIPLETAFGVKLDVLITLNITSRQMRRMSWLKELL